ncbi:AI-2E family transporter [Gorillibacterium timonense]|uniref:AI-2E family transporter n=1 Tax=Gorillibacterium timonense TaxID=1689269 RepID=UPI00071CDB81|nr:AI-2E family transporter [Gorillibacterium timonense]
MLQSRFFRNSLKIIAVLLIIFLTTKVSFLLNPIISMIKILALPFMLAGFFYYMFRPLVNYLTRRKVNRSAAILLLYFVLAGFITLLAILVWPLLRTQVQNLMNNIPQLVSGFQIQLNQLQDSRFFSMLGPNETDWTQNLTKYLDSSITYVTNYLSNSVSAFTNFLFVISTVPFILYYMLKEGGKLSKAVLKVTPRAYRKDVKEALSDMDGALSGYIVGRVIITSLLALMMYIGFLFIGLPYSLLLAVVSLFFNLIPYIGQFLGAIPCLIVGFIDSPTTAIWVLVIILVAQQIEGNLLAPHIYGKRLDVHPLTTVVLVLVGGDLLGIVGILAALPIYLVAKIIVVLLYRLFLAEKVEEFVE